MNPSISASLALTADGGLRVQAAIVGADGRTFELRVPSVERAVGCTHDGAALVITGPEATVSYRVDGAARYTSADRTVLRLSHSDLHASWKLSALLPTPFGLDERFALALDLPAGFRVAGSNADTPESLVWRDTTRLAPYLVASTAPMERFSTSARVGGRDLAIVCLGEDLTGPAREILVRLGEILGPLSTPRVVIDVTGTLPAMEYRDFVRSNLGNLRHELAHQWFGTVTDTTDAADLWIDEAAVMVLTEAERVEIADDVAGLTDAPNGCIPRLAYHYGADTLRRSVDSREDLIRLLRAVVDGGVSSADAIREHLAPERRAWFDRRLGERGAPASGSSKGARVGNDIADWVFGSSLAAMASASQLADGPSMVFELTTKKAVAYRFPTGASTAREFWALADGWRLGPASASDPAVSRSFDMPTTEPASETWSAFVTWANAQFSGTKDWYDHTITIK